MVVFDTAPTGHTIRFLSMPSLFVKGLGKMTQLKGQFGGIFQQIMPALGIDGGSAKAQMMESLPAIEQINAEFKDAVSC